MDGDLRGGFEKNRPNERDRTLRGCGSLRHIARNGGSCGDGVQIPTLIIHEDADEIVPYWMGEHLAYAIAGARLVRIAGAHHGDLFSRDGAHLLEEIVTLGGNVRRRRIP